jgi:hypothetical protein
MGSMAGLFFSCKPNVSFNEKDNIIVSPFKKTDTIVYVSSVGIKYDTIIFFSPKRDTLKFRSFEQGFYDQYVLKLNYTVSLNSYHKILNQNEVVLFYSSSVSDIRSKELCFLGLIFDEDVLNHLPIDKEIITFNGEQAKYRGMNINEGIKSFDFSVREGIISYIDTTGAVWKRINLR